MWWGVEVCAPCERGGGMWGVRVCRQDVGGCDVCGEGDCVWGRLWLWGLWGRMCGYGGMCVGHTHILVCPRVTALPMYRAGQIGPSIGPIQPGGCILPTPDLNDTPWLSNAKICVNAKFSIETVKSNSEQ